MWLRCSCGVSLPRSYQYLRTKSISTYQYQVTDNYGIGYPGFHTGFLACGEGFYLCIDTPRDWNRLHTLIKINLHSSVMIS